MHLFRLSFLLRRLVLDFEMKKAIIRIQLRWMTQIIEWWLRGETGKSPPSDDQLHIVANAKIITWHERCFRFRLSDCWVGRGECVGEGVNEGRRRNWFPEVHPVSIRTTALRHDRFPSSLPSSPLPASPLPSSPRTLSAASALIYEQNRSRSMHALMRKAVHLLSSWQPSSRTNDWLQEKWICHTVETEEEEKEEEKEEEFRPCCCISTGSRRPNLKCYFDVIAESFFLFLPFSADLYALT